MTEDHQALKYSFDTSAIIDGLERYYPEDSFPAFWSRVDELIEENRLLVSEEVWEEVKDYDKPAKDWLEGRRDSVLVPTDDVVAGDVKAILGQYPLMVKVFKNRNRADPFVIAVARLREAVVVTGEGDDGNEKRPKIPFVCQQLGLQCIKLIDVVRQEHWQF